MQNKAFEYGCKFLLSVWIQVTTFSMFANFTFRMDASYYFQYGCNASHCLQYGCNLLLSVWLQVTTFSMVASYYFQYSCNASYCLPTASFLLKISFKKAAPTCLFDVPAALHQHITVISINSQV